MFWEYLKDILEYILEVCFRHVSGFFDGTLGSIVGLCWEFVKDILGKCYGYPKDV